MSSVLLALSALWARIRFDSSILPSWLRPILTFFHYIAHKIKKPKNEPLHTLKALWATDLLHKKKKHPMTFFHYIAHDYQADEDNLEEEGRKYFEEQIDKFTRDDELLTAIAVEITILSSHLSKKYQLINLSFISAALALALMSSLIIFLAHTSYSQPASTPIQESQAEKCAKNPEAYNVSHVRECSKFTEGSLAEKCASYPSEFNRNLSGCSAFIPS